ncbi:MAG TPA: hypothetical protein VMM35_05975 [Longimicrobiales bacterium]|nr:hypothetical protein [Longimicrobiales bacterium]
MAPSANRTALLVVLVLSNGCSEPEPKPVDELLRQGDVFLHPTTLEPYSGPVFTTFADAPLRIEKRASLREGHYDGPFEWYFGNRQLSVRENYRAGMKDGPYEWYFESGELYERGTYENGLQEGPYEARYETGQLYEKGTYRKGEFHGLRQWFLAGQLIEQVTYVHGRILGPYARYTAEGELDLEGWLQDGQPCGRWLEGQATVVHPPCGYDS